MDSKNSPKRPEYNEASHILKATASKNDASKSSQKEVSTVSILIPKDK